MEKEKIRYIDYYKANRIGKKIKWATYEEIKIIWLRPEGIF